MDALTNALTRRGGNNPPSDGVASIATPEVQDLRTGVSSDYIPAQDHHWFVFRAIYNQVDKVCKILKEKDVCIYIPLHYVLKIKNGKKKRVLKPLLPNLVFAYMTRKQADCFVRKPSDTSEYMKYYLDKTATKEASGYHPPLIVKDSDMANFIRATIIENDHIMTVSPEYCHYKSGDLVRVIDGDFKGVVGRVARISGQQRVVVEIKNLCLVATAYIPSAFLEPYRE